MATMRPFKLELANGATLTGLENHPSITPTAASHRPLIVGLHGGGYSARYYDATAKYTASTPSTSLQVPFVAINRPGYLDSTSFYPIPPNSTYIEMYADWLHKYILPALWKEFGLPQRCNSIVLHCHSMGAPGAIIAAVQYAGEDNDKHAYPLAGIVFSGWGAHAHDTRQNLPGDVDHIGFPIDVKFKIMLPSGTAEDEVYTAHEKEGMNTGIPKEELACVFEVWGPRWKEEWAVKVRVPVMVGLASLEGLWDNTVEALKEIGEAFTASSRVDTSFIEGAPHNIELSHWAQGWYAKTFGFALECAASFAAKK